MMEQDATLFNGMIYILRIEEEAYGKYKTLLDFKMF